METNEADKDIANVTEKFDAFKYIADIRPQPARMDDGSCSIICGRFDVDMGIYWDMREQLMRDAAKARQLHAPGTVENGSGSSAMTPILTYDLSSTELEELASNEEWNLRWPLADELSDPAPIVPSSSSTRPIKKPPKKCPRKAIVCKSLERPKRKKQLRIRI